MLPVALLVSGCGLTTEEKAAIGSFGTATSSYADSISQLASTIPDKTRSLFVERYGLPGQSAAQGFAAITKVDQNASTEPFYDGVPLGAKDVVFTDAVRNHVDLVNDLAVVMKEYGVALSQLADYGDQSARSQTIIGIASNADKILNSPATQSVAKDLGVGIGAVLNQLIEVKKAQTIKETVSAFDPFVTASCELLAAEFDGNHSGTIMVAYLDALRAYQETIPDLDQIAPLNTYGTPKPGSKRRSVDYVSWNTSAQLREKIISSYATLVDSADYQAAVLKQAGDASAKLRSANAALASSLANDTMTTKDVESFITATYKLYQTANKK